MIMYRCLVLLSFLLLLTASCQNGDNDPAQPGAVNPDLSAGAVHSVLGDWTVALFLDEDENETSSFHQIVFTFKEGGEFELVRNGNLLTSGSWSLRNNAQELDINVPLLAGENEIFGEDVYEIHDDWRIDFISEEELHLVEEDERFELRRL